MKKLLLISVFCVLAFQLLALPFSLHNSSLDYGLVGHWTFNEGGGTVASDSSGLANFASFTNTPSWLNGIIGSAINFKTSSALVIQTDSPFPVGTNARTVTAWICVTNRVSGAAIFSYGQQSSGKGWTFSLATSNTNGVGVFGFSVNPSASSLTAIPTNQWVHVAASDSAGNIVYFFNGITNGTATHIINTSLGGLATIGMATPPWDGPHYFGGFIDDVRIYNRALSSDEVKQLYGGGYGTP